MKNIDLRKVIIFILAILFIVFFKYFIINKIMISGNSMADTFKNGDVVWIEKISYRYEINRFDVVIINPHKELFRGNIIKRVIGLPNETVLIDGGKVYINGELLKDDYGDLLKNSGGASSPIILGSTEYFVLGDNRNESIDSRELGPIDHNRIIGKPLLRFFPFNRIGWSF